FYRGLRTPLQARPVIDACAGSGTGESRRRGRPGRGLAAGLGRVGVVARRRTRLRIGRRGRRGVAGGLRVPGDRSGRRRGGALRRGPRAPVRGAVPGGGFVEAAGEQGVVAVEQVLGDRSPRADPTQSAELFERFAQLVELRSHVFAQLRLGAGDVVAGGAQTARQ